MSSNSQLKDKEQYLFCDVLRLTQLGVWLVNSTNGGVIVHNSLESSHLMKVKNEKNSDPILLKLNKIAHNQ